MDIQVAMERLVKRFNETVSAKYAVQAEQFAKDNAPWENRTGDARKLLKGVVLNGETAVDTEAGRITIGKENSIGFALVHRVKYGKWLEVANSNKYAILKPTIEAHRTEFLETVRKFFGGKR
jgi:hypothetical protein